MGLNRTFQIPSVFKSLTVYQNILLAGKRSSRKETVEALISALGLEKYANVKAANLPCGMMKILELTVTMASNPTAILLDEPTAGLTMHERQQIVELLKRLPEKYTIVMVEHDTDLIFGFASRVVVMHRGEVLADGRPEEIAVDTRVREVYLG